MARRVTSVEVRDAVVLRGRHRAIDQVSLKIAAGDWVAFIGRNGAGKSTLLNCIAGLLKPASGDVACEGSVGLVLQRMCLDPLLTVQENAMLFARLHGVPPELASASIDRLLNIGGLADRKHAQVGTLSGGLARRADLIRACIVSPDILILDEPTAGLDQIAREAFLNLVSQIRADRDITVLWATHDDGEARAADRVVVLNRSRVVADGPPETLDAGEEMLELRLGGGIPELLTQQRALERVKDAMTQGVQVSIDRPSLLGRTLSQGERQQ